MARTTSMAAIMRELGEAVRDPFTYAPGRNNMALVGLLWGIPIPVVSLAIDVYARGETLGPASVAEAVARRPVHLLLILHPLLFAWVFGLFGTLQRRKSERISSLIGDLERQARTDGLTGLFNHRVFHEVLALEIERARRQRTPLSLLMIDIDDFKALNDRWGHPVGDRVLAELARRLAELLRDYDIAARYGGEEFTVVLPGADAEEGLRIAERIRERIGGEPFRVRHGLGQDRVTASIGVAMFPDHGSSKAALLEAADLALYRAKGNGKNRVARALDASGRNREPWRKEES